MFAKKYKYTSLIIDFLLINFYIIIIRVKYYNQIFKLIIIEFKIINKQ